MGPVKAGEKGRFGRKRLGLAGEIRRQAVQIKAREDVEVCLWIGVSRFAGFLRSDMGECQEHSGMGMPGGGQDF